jgi:hypothetical protein
VAVAASVFEWAQVVAAAGAIVVAGLVAWLPYFRRPKLDLEEDTDRVHSHVEADGVPYLRLLVANAKRKRAARGTRVLVEGYRPQGDSRLITLGHPSLGWPSAPEATQTAAIEIFGGGRRPIGFGRLIHARMGDEGRLMRPNAIDPSTGRSILGVPHYPEAEDGRWYLWLDLAYGLDILDDRDKLPPRDGGYSVRLIVGADDGDAKSYEVDIAWDGGAPDAQAAMRSALEHLAVRKV